MAEFHVEVDLWQVSHTVAPTCTEVLGLPTAGGKLPEWQVAHWFDTDTALWKRAGAQALKPALWQVSQLALAAAEIVWYGMWFARLVSAGGNAPLWQLAHWFATVTCVWFHLDGTQPVTLWQLAQLAAPTGMWLPGLPVTPPPPLWQPAQLVATVKVL